MTCASALAMIRTISTWKRRMLPRATVVPVRHPGEFFEGNVEDLDALIGAAEIGSAWSLQYPNYAVAVPDDRSIEGIPLAYPVAPSHYELLFFVNDWIALKKRDGTIQRLYDYWILGQETEVHEPRWSVIRNGLGMGRVVQ